MKIRRDPLDKLFSDFIRQRDKVCQRCGSSKGWKYLHCAHFHSRRKKATRHDEENCVSLCFGCHQYFHENPREFEEFMRQRLGDRFDLLEGRSRVLVKYIDRTAIELYLKQELENLKGGNI